MLRAFQHLAEMLKVVVATKIFFAKQSTVADFFRQVKLWRCVTLYYRLFFRSPLDNLTYGLYGHFLQYLQIRISRVLLYYMQFCLINRDNLVYEQNHPESMLSVNMDYKVKQKKCNLALCGMASTIVHPAFKTFF